MNKYKFKGKIITASSRKEAIAKIIASNKCAVRKVTASSNIELDDDVWEKYGNDYLYDEESGENVAHKMTSLDSEIGDRSPSEAIMDAYCGYDFNDDRNENTRFNPNEDYFAINDLGNLVSIRKGFLADWFKFNITESDFIEWLKNNDKEEYKEAIRDATEKEIELARSKRSVFGFDFKNSSDYSDVEYDKDNDTLRAGDCSIEYDYNTSLDSNLQSLYDEIISEHHELEIED